ncbi:MAG: tetratricopeptide repeat protein [Bacteroidales bacterium]|nr:tetratricopeptide repeat protein [Bacteroidales bacterium]
MKVWEDKWISIQSLFVKAGRPMNIKIILHVYLACLFTIGFSQEKIEINKMKGHQLLGMAKSAERLGDPVTSIKYYNAYLKKRPGNLKAKYSLAKQCQQIRDYKTAAIYFDEVYNRNPKKYLEALYAYALMQKSMGNYTQAIESLNSIYKIKRRKKIPRYLLNYLQTDIEGCELAMEQKDTIAEITIVCLNNSDTLQNSASCPLYIDHNTIMFGASNYNSTFEVSIDSVSQYPQKTFTTISVDSGKTDGGFIVPNSVIPDQIVHNKNVGHFSFSLDSNRIYYTICFTNWKLETICNLWVIQKDSSGWQNPQKLSKDINHPRYTSTQPTVGTCYDNTLEVIYFISDRPGGIGGNDIWYVVYDKFRRTYQKAENAGAFINTEGNEATPFYDRRTKLLYFSSDRWPGFGGYDIYSAEGELVSWSNIKNLGYPINSPVDEYYFVSNPFTGTPSSDGAFISNRAVSGETGLKTSTLATYDRLFFFFSKK